MNRLSTAIRTLAWANYLGMSWTWCVGMFLPVVLYRELGLAAWVAITVPNVIGAASVGFTFARPGTSAAATLTHRDAVVGFSAITLAFHAFFLFWLAHAGIVPPVAAAAAVVVGVVFGLVRRRAMSVDLLLGLAVLAVSAVVMAHGLAHVRQAVLAPTGTPGTPTALGGLALVCAFGFLTCPYLDVTFHRACQSLPPNPKRAAFGLGLGVLFLSMIAGTTLYAGDFDRASVGAFARAGLATWVATHVCVQCGYKFAVHLRALPRWRSTDGLIWGGAAATAALFAVGLLSGAGPALHAPDGLVLNGQVYYRLFMSFYGLLFPAYVWLCMVPLPGRPATGPTRRSLIVLAIAVVLAAPMYWVAFLDDRWAWIVPGIGVVLAARAFVPAGSGRTAD